MRLIDTHTHLAGREYAADLEQVLARARHAGVDRWIAIGTNLQDSAAAIELTRKYPEMYCSVGIHPHETARQEQGYLKKLQNLAGAEKVNALGEIGLDVT